MSAIRKTIVAQFRRPAGPLGVLAGRIMATRPSNRKRNGWTVDLLSPAPGEALLEIGCGPGLALELVAKHAPGVHLTALDHSALMLAQARRRLNRDASAAFVNGDLGTIAGWPGRFDGIYSVNVVQFFENMDAAYRLISQALKPGGRVVTTYQPRQRNPTTEAALQMATRISDAMTNAGFAETRVHELPLEPVMAICVTGARPR